MSAEDESQPVPNWLLKLEEQRERRLKAKLGHEAGAGAKCQKCEDKCPGLDLHFWRKICKACKCGKEDHDIIDDDFCGFVQFQLLGSKPVKSKGVFLKGLKDEVILEWTPKGSSNDIKKYLDELPADMIPVKGSEGAKIRKQRLQKQMPAHDIDASLCHQLTEDEIKEMEEYVSHIRKNCVGQGKIIRLSLFKGSQHKIPPSNSQFLSQIPPAQIASSQTVFLQSSDMANNLHNLSIRDPKSATQNQGNNDPNSAPHAQKPQVANFASQNVLPIVDNQNPSNLGKLTDMNYYPSVQQNVQNVVHPLTTSNVERHQEQYEIQNANFDKILNPHLNYTPNYLNPVEQHQLPSQVGQLKDLKYPVGGSIPNTLQQNANVDNVYNPNYVNPIDQYQIPSQVGQPKDLKYPVGSNPNTLQQNANVDKVYNPNYVNPIDQYQIPSQVGQPKDLKYPTGSFDNQNVPRFNNANIDKITNPLMQYNPNYVNPVDQAQIPTQIGQPKDIKHPIGSNPPPINTSTHPLMQRNSQGGPTQELQYPQNLVGPNQDKLNPNYSTLNNANMPLQQYNPNFVNPTENVQLPSQIGQLTDLKYPTLDQNNPVNANQIGQYPNYTIGPNGEPILGHPDGGKYPSGIQNVDQINPVNANPIGQYPNLKQNPLNVNIPLGQYTPNEQTLHPLNPSQIGGIHPLTSQIDQTNPQIPYNPESRENPNYTHSDLKPKPLIPILEAQSAINPFESHQNLQSVGYIRDIDYPTENIPPNSNLPPKSSAAEPTLPSMDQNSNQPAVIQKCHNCKDHFEDGNVAISVDRTNHLWHAKCFNCDSCKQPLADLLYFYHKENDNIYCGRDYAILKGIPRCLACDELIFVREYCLAEDNTFHIKHFCCFECDEPLAGKQYIMENNQPVCISCYENLKAEKCNDCSMTIRPDQQGVSLQNLHWHACPECFACKKCRKSLLGSKMLLRNQNLFCSDVCFKSF